MIAKLFKRNTAYDNFRWKSRVAIVLSCEFLVSRLLRSRGVASSGKYLPLQGLYFRRWNNPATRDTTITRFSRSSLQRGWKSRPRRVFKNGLIAFRLRSDFRREFTALSRYRADTIEAENKQHKWLKMLSRVNSINYESTQPRYIRYKRRLSGSLRRNTSIEIMSLL